MRYFVVFGPANFWLEMRFLFENKRFWIDEGAFGGDDFEMEVGGGGAAGFSDGSDGLAGFDFVSFFDQIFFEVGVTGFKAVFVADYHNATVSFVSRGPNHGSPSGSIDLFPPLSLSLSLPSNIDSCVKSSSSPAERR